MAPTMTVLLAVVGVTTTKSLFYWQYVIKGYFQLLGLSFCEVAIATCKKNLKLTHATAGCSISMLKSNSNLYLYHHGV